MNLINFEIVKIQQPISWNQLFLVKSFQQVCVFRCFYLCLCSKFVVFHLKTKQLISANWLLNLGPKNLYLKKKSVYQCMYNILPSAKMLLSSDLVVQHFLKKKVVWFCLLKNISVHHNEKLFVQRFWNLNTFAGNTGKSSFASWIHKMISCLVLLLLKTTIIVEAK